jgi:MFS family permease
MGILSLYFFKRFKKKSLFILSASGILFTLFFFSYATSFKMIMAGSLLFGFFAGLLGLLPNVLVPSATSIGKRQQVLAGLHSMYGISSLFAPIFVAVLIKYFESWRDVFKFSAIFAFILIIYLLFIDSALFEQKIEDEVHQLDENKKLDHPYFKNFIFAPILSFAVMTEVMISSRLSLFLFREGHFNFVDASIGLTYFFIALLIGRLVFTFFKFPFSLIKQVTFLEIATILLIICGIYFNPYFLIFAGLTIAPVYPLIAAIIAEEFKGHLDRAMTICVSMNSLLLAFMHIFIGKLTDLLGLKFAMLFGVIFLLSSIFLLNFSDLFLRKNNLKKLQ